MTILIGISIIFTLIALILKIARLLHLTIPLTYIAVVTIFFNDWYTQNTMLAHSVLAIIVLGILISWIVRGINKIRTRQVERNRAELDAIINSERIYYRKIERSN